MAEQKMYCRILDENSFKLGEKVYDLRDPRDMEDLNQLGDLIESQLTIQEQALERATEILSNTKNKLAMGKTTQEAVNFAQSTYNRCKAKYENKMEANVMLSVKIADAWMAIEKAKEIPVIATKKKVGRPKKTA